MSTYARFVFGALPFSLCLRKAWRAQTKPILLKLWLPQCLITLQNVPLESDWCRLSEFYAEIPTWAGFFPFPVLLHLLLICLPLPERSSLNCLLWNTPVSFFHWKILTKTFYPNPKAGSLPQMKSHQLAN